MLGFALTGSMILIVFLTGLWFTRKGPEDKGREKDRASS